MGLDMNRRSFIGGTVAAMIGLSGCQRIPDAGPGRETLSTQLEQSGPTRPASATFVIGHREGRTVSMVGATGEIAIEAPKGEADARVIQQTFDSLPEGGGSVFIENGTYEIGRYDEWNAGVKVHTSNVDVISDYAHLRFHEHSPDAEFLMDFAIGAVENVRIRGLVLDGNREERSNPTRTVDVSESSNVTIADSVIFGGRRVERAGGAGYGIGPYGVDGLTVANCLITDSDRHGIHPGANDGIYRDVRIVNNTFTGNALNPTGAAIDIRDRIQDVIVRGNYIAENGNGIRIKGEKTNTIHISGNILRNNQNDLDDSSQIEIVADGFDRHVISDNQFLLDGDSETESRHVLLAPSAEVDEITIRDNDARGGDYFVEARIDDEFSFLNIADNSVAETAVGVAIEGVDRSLIRDNVFRSIADHAIRPEDGRGALLDNVLQDASIDVSAVESGYELVDNLTL